MSEDSFYQKALMAIESRLNQIDPVVIVLIGGNSDSPDDRQMEIYKLVTYCDSIGQYSVWFESTENLHQNLEGHVLKGEKKEIIYLNKL